MRPLAGGFDEREDAVKEICAATPVDSSTSAPETIIDATWKSPRSARGVIDTALPRHRHDPPTT